MLDSLYSWIKALHVLCAMLFVTGLICTALALALIRTRVIGAQILIPVLRRWDSRVTIPAMVGVWGLGIIMAQMVGWFADGWLQAKLTFVLFLSAIHGIQSGRLRRIASGTIEVGGRDWLPAILLSVGVIVTLAVVKP